MAGLYEVVFEGEAYSQQITTVRYYQAVAESLDHQDVADVMGSYWFNNHNPIVGSYLSMTGIKFRLLDVPSPGVTYVPADWPYTGDIATEGEPSFLAVDVVHFGGEARYPNRGRSRLAGAVEAQKAGNNLTAGAVVLWQGFAAFFSTVIVTSGSGIWTPVLYSQVYSPPNVLAISVVNERVTTQNSRKIGVGA